MKNLSGMQETWVRFLGQEDTLEKEMATHSSILTWRFPWTEDPGRLQSMDHKSRTLLKRLSITQHKAKRIYFFKASDTADAAVQLLSHVRLFATSRTVACWVLCPWDFPGENTGVGCHFLLQGIFLTQGLNLGLLHWQGILYH